MKDKRFVVAVSGIYCDIFATVLENRRSYIDYAKRRKVTINPANTLALFMGTSAKGVLSGASHGEVIFTRQDCTPELISHECFHAIHHSFLLQKKKLKKHEEAFAILLGELISEVTKWLAS